MMTHEPDPAAGLHETCRRLVCSRLRFCSAQSVALAMTPVVAHAANRPLASGRLAPATMKTMTPRKPTGVRFESWVDRQIRQAAERGGFSNLPGSGTPLAGLDEPYDEMWWVKRKLRSENLSYLPPSLALRKEAHEALDGAACAKTEVEVRERIAAINDKIRDAIRMGIRGPELNLVPFDVEKIVKQWRRAQTKETQPSQTKKTEPS